MARFLAAVMIHPAGLGGIPAEGHRDRVSPARGPGPPVATVSIEAEVLDRAEEPGTSERFDTMKLPGARDVVAPDGSDVRVLLQLGGGSMAHFELASGRTSRAVTHRSVAELWYIVAGCGQMWRRDDDREETVTLEPGTCLSIPAGTHFQFRSAGGTPLAAIAVTMPPWPGEDEAREVPGAWPVSERG
jgi:mannose-6-phosphate isomerase-like protein (cupin superfamily)